MKSNDKYSQPPLLNPLSCLLEKNHFAAIVITTIRIRFDKKYLEYLLRNREFILLGNQLLVLNQNPDKNMQFNELPLLYDLNFIQLQHP